MIYFRGFSDEPPFLFRFCPLLLLLILTGCTSVPAGSAALDLYIIDLEVARDRVTERIGILVQNDPFGTYLEGRHSTPAKLTTVPITLSIKQLKHWADPHGNAPGGKSLRARLTLEFQLREQINDARNTRIIIRPVFEVYVSRWGDRRQWIEWMSNGVVETIIEDQLRQNP